MKEKAEKNSSSNNRHMQVAEKESINDCQMFDSRTPKNPKEWNEDRVDSKVGKAAGISRMQIYKIEKIKETADEAELKDLRAGKKTINKSYMEKKREAKQEMAWF